MESKYTYLICCVDADGEKISDMVDSARQITLRTLRKRCDIAELEKGLGYNKHFKLDKDYHVRYYKSTYRGEKCYFISHSCIEYVFTAN
jgi:CDP-glycerol glycerophosphotransferase (TagB/SpsB family)